jgi:antirestriction protein
MKTNTTTYFEWHEDYEELDHFEYKAFIHFLHNEHQNEDSPYDSEMVERFQNDYVGIYDSFQDFVQEAFDDSNDIPPHLAGYIDYKAVANDWSHNYWTSEDGHVFRHS